MTERASLPLDDHRFSLIRSIGRDQFQLGEIRPVARSVPRQQATAGDRGVSSDEDVRKRGRLGSPSPTIDREALARREGRS